MKVESILADKGRDVRTIESSATVGKALVIMRDERIGALVVSGDGVRIDGLISERDILRAIADEGAVVVERPVREVMTSKVFTCSPADRISSVTALMTERRIRHIPVVEDSRLCGIVSIGDVVKHRLDEVQNEADAMRDYITRTR